MSPKKRNRIGRRKANKSRPPAPDPATSSPTKPTATPSYRKPKTPIPRVPFVSPAAEQQKRQRNHFPRKNIN